MSKTTCNSLLLSNSGNLKRVQIIVSPYVRLTASLASLLQFTEPEDDVILTDHGMIPLSVLQVQTGLLNRPFYTPSIVALYHISLSPC